MEGVASSWKGHKMVSSVVVVMVIWYEVFWVFLYQKMKKGQKGGRVSGVTELCSKGDDT